MPVFTAGSLAVPFKELEAVFEAQNPGVDVRRQTWGSRTALRQVTELGKKADIIGSSDYSIIPDMMFPEYAEWYIAFAHNEMVLCYRDNAPYADQIVAGTKMWYDVLANRDVTFGHSDPDQDPCGYRTLMVWQLAQAYYYDNPTADTSPAAPSPDPNAQKLYHRLHDEPLTADGGRREVRPKEVELTSLLQAGELDYAFEYLSLAEQHDLNYILLPDRINLSSMEHKDFYAMATVQVTGKEPGTWTTVSGKPIVYGITIPKNAEHPDLGIKFIQLLLSDRGKQILEHNGQPPLDQPFTNDRSKLPAELRDLVPIEV